MIHYAVYDPASGEIVRSGQCQQDSLSLQSEFVLSAEHECLDKDWYVLDGELTEYTTAQKAAKLSQPRLGMVWSNVTMSWVEPRPLAQVKEEKRKELTHSRELANNTTFTFAGKAIAVDRISKDDISGVTQEIAMTGSLPVNFPGAWKAADNSYVMIPDVATWRSFVQAMVAQGTANFARMQALKTLVDNATTATEVASINWDTPLT